MGTASAFAVRLSNAMNEIEITRAINKARRGIDQYLEIMRLFQKTDVSNSRYFQTAYNALYRVRQRPSEWYQEYYKYMEEMKGHSVTFSIILRHFDRKLGRYEPSFSSKLLHTLDTSFPVWDTHVLSNIGLRAPSYASRRKYEQAESTYKAIEDWYQIFLCTADGKSLISKFDELVAESPEIADIKKIDFVLWQTRT